MTSSISSLSSATIQTQVASYEKTLELPVTALKNEITTDKAEISAWGSIQSSVSTLSSALSGIKDVASINNRTATSAQTTIATASATNSAATGTYTLSNIKLATGQSIYSALQGSAGAKLSGGAGSMTFTMKGGATETVAVSSASMTLTGIAAAINKQAGGVKANIVTAASGTRLVLQSSATGSAGAFSVTGTGALSRFAYSAASPGSETLTQSAKDASLSLNGVPITSASNTLSNAVGGLTVKLAASGSTSISVASSPSSLSTALSQVSTDLNKAISTIAGQIKYVSSASAAKASAASASASTKSGPLLGNFTATDLSSQLMSSVSEAQASGISAASIGLKVGTSGAISFDSTSFASAYAKNPKAVQTLVSQIYTSLSTVTKAAIGSGSASTGTIGAATSGLTTTDNSITTQITQMTKIDTALINNLLNQYATAESSQTSASISQAYLSVFLSSNSSSSG
ncbi:flagellar filament capping protein FliD [Acidocella facilis]|uniref:flagellar filament capping protein FliD n=1 Tax=Acidocella facilis TaxID=525 RepID=UPI001F1E0212|nr:flagellar filament capping protein FliD [Acidocella facilis]